ncbi:hypothetical protein [Lysobacter sp. TAB13]|uniref:hypothetical protein n=1 Tax=Lysobacter sp. TAB13 TaxID=3233065 RepID=UPI003F94A4CE
MAAAGCGADAAGGDKRTGGAVGGNGFGSDDDGASVAVGRGAGALRAAGGAAIGLAAAGGGTGCGVTVGVGVAPPCGRVTNGVAAARAIASVGDSRSCGGGGRTGRAPGAGFGAAAGVVVATGFGAATGAAGAIGFDAATGTDGAIGFGTAPAVAGAAGLGATGFGSTDVGSTDVGSVDFGAAVGAAAAGGVTAGAGAGRKGTAVVVAGNAGGVARTGTAVVVAGNAGGVARTGTAVVVAGNTGRAGTAVGVAGNTGGVGRGGTGEVRDGGGAGGGRTLSGGDGAGASVCAGGADCGAGAGCACADSVAMNSRPAVTLARQARIESLNIMFPTTPVGPAGVASTPGFDRHATRHWTHRPGSSAGSVRARRWPQPRRRDGSRPPAHRACLARACGRGATAVGVSTAPRPQFDLSRSGCANARGDHVRPGHRANPSTPRQARPTPAARPSRPLFSKLLMQFLKLNNAAPRSLGKARAPA